MSTNADMTQRANTASALARRAEYEAADEPSPEAYRNAADAHRQASAAQRACADAAQSPNVVRYCREKAATHDRLASELERAALRA